MDLVIYFYTPTNKRATQIRTCKSEHDKLVLKGRKLSRDWPAALVMHSMLDVLTAPITQTDTEI